MRRRSAALLTAFTLTAVPVSVARATTISFAGENQVGVPAFISSNGGNAQVTVANTGTASVVTVTSSDALTVQPKSGGNPAPTECSAPVANQTTCTGVPAFFVSLTGPNTFTGTVVTIPFVMTGAPSAAVTVHGGDSGNDLQGSPGPDTLVGGTGNDTFIPGGGADTIGGGTGRDTVAYTDSVHTAAGVTIAQAGSDLSVIGKDGADGVGDGLSGIEDVVLSKGPDGGQVATAGVTLEGGDGDDDLTVTGADASLAGDAGNDTLSGGPGAQTLNGGEGNDTLTGGDGADILAGGPGDDVMQARDGVAEQVDCGDGTDSGQADDSDTLVGCENVATPASEQAATNPPAGQPPGGSPPPVVVSAFPHVAVAFSARWRVARDKTATAVRSLRVARVPKGGKVVVSCASKRRGCPFSRKRIVSSKGGTVRLESLFTRRSGGRRIPAQLKPGAVVKVVVTAPQQLGRRATYKLPRGRAPRAVVTCLSAAGAAERC